MLSYTSQSQNAGDSKNHNCKRAWLHRKLMSPMAPESDQAEGSETDRTSSKGSKALRLFDLASCASQSQQFAGPHVSANEGLRAMTPH